MTTTRTRRPAKPIGYHAYEPPASEPTAWAALAALAAGDRNGARTLGDWLRKHQARDGSVGVTPDQPTPAWPTALAMLVWARVDKAFDKPRYESAIARAADWALATRGRTVERKPQIGHDTTLVGWSWAADTHSWLEPTAFFVRGLIESGHADHPRVDEGTRLLVDRLLPTGGANYGNTRVLDQHLLPHVQPTGIVLWSLAATEVMASGSDPRVPLSVEYLKQQLHAAADQPLGAASLAFALIGLSACSEVITNADELIAEAASRDTTAASPYRQALLAFASESLA